jgi:hypothetical protein
VVPQLVDSVEVLPNALEKVSFRKFNVTSLRPHKERNRRLHQRRHYQPDKK